MAQFALLIILVIVVLMLLSGGSHARREPAEVAADRSPTSCPSRHFVSFSQVIIYRGGGLERGLAPVPDGERRSGSAFFVYSLALFRKSIAVTK